MKKTIVYIIVFGILGLIIGYLIFGRISNEYVSLKLIFGSSNNAFESFGKQITGLAKMKQNILISGALGAILGLVIKIFKK